MVMLNEQLVNVDPGDILTPLAYASIIAANTTTTLYQISPGNTAKLRKLMVTNRTGGNGFLRLGYLNAAATFVQVFPDILLINGVDLELNEADLPNYWWRGTGYNLTDIVAQASVGAASPTDVQVFIEVFEKGAE